MKDISAVLEAALAKIGSANTLHRIETLRIELLGRKGLLNSFLSDIPKLQTSERGAYGKTLNKAKERIAAALETREMALQRDKISKLKKKTIDVTVPGIVPDIGHTHPISQTIWEILATFEEMGYELVEGPEVETERYNFELLNIPKHHPARDLQDTFWLTNGLLPRTHTSSMQVREMEHRKPPFKIAVPGWVYRQEREDATHAASFHQVEGFVVGSGISFSDLKGTLFSLLRTILGSDTKLKFRASYFPYVEPCAEVSATCPHCKGSGCSVCKDSGWIEILGSGMIHPTVLKNAGVDPAKYSGFAFAFGSTRLAMIRYKIDDIRLFTGGDLRFLNQF